MKNKISIIIRVIVSFGLLTLLFWFMRDDIGNIGAIFTECRKGLLILAGALLILNVTVLSLRLKEIFIGENLDINVSKSLQLTLIGYFFNNFMPTAVGGDLIKAHYAANDNNKRVQSYASVLMDRLLGLYTFLIIAAVALLIDWGNFQMKALRPMVFLLLSGGIVLFIVMTNHRFARIMEKLFENLKMFKLGEKLESIYSIVHDYKNRKDIIVKSIVISIFGQCLYFIVVYIFFISLGNPVRLGNIFLIMPIVTFISMIPSIGGLGVREGAMVALFSPLVGRDAAFAAGLLLLSGLIFISAIGGCVYLWWQIKAARKVKGAGNG